MNKQKFFLPRHCLLTESKKTVKIVKKIPRVQSNLYDVTILYDFLTGQLCKFFVYQQKAKIAGNYNYSRQRLLLMQSVVKLRDFEKKEICEKI